MAQGRLLASTIPNARLVTLDSRNHILGESEPAWQDFLREIDASGERVTKFGEPGCETS